MTPEPTTEQRLRALVEAAAPGPWECDEDPCVVTNFVRQVLTARRENTAAVVALHNAALPLLDVVAAGRAVDEWESDELTDLSDCPYYARYCSLPGFDPDATCSYGCQDEPECITGTPSEGWPRLRLRDALARLDEQARP